MDGVFVPNLSFGLPVLEGIRRATDKPLDVHLMIVDPDRYLEAFAKAGANILTVHYEACTHLDRTLHQIRALGMQAGVVLNPHTPVSLLENVLHLCDLVLLMSVNPGFGGQKFIPHTVKKVQQLRAMIDTAGLGTLIEIDGGVTDENAGGLVEAGADVLVAGSYVFATAEPQARIETLKQFTRPASRLA
jgi:ribulose-phosphate 3-epimerase